MEFDHRARSGGRRALVRTLLIQPGIQRLRTNSSSRQVRVRSDDTVDFFELARLRDPLPGRGTSVLRGCPDAEDSWSPAMQPAKWFGRRTGRHSRPLVGGLRQNFRDTRRIPRRRIAAAMNAVEQFDRAARPYRPLAEQPAAKTRRASSDTELRKQIGDDVVVVPG